MDLLAMLNDPERHILQAQILNYWLSVSGLWYYTQAKVYLFTNWTLTVYHLSVDSIKNANGFVVLYLVIIVKARLGDFYVPLTHLSLDKMATNMADDIFKCIFLNENDGIPIQISLKIVPSSPIDNILALVQMMA